MYRAKLISADFEESTMEFEIQDKEFTVKKGDYVILPKESFKELSDKANYENYESDAVKQSMESILKQWENSYKKAQDLYLDLQNGKKTLDEILKELSPKGIFAQDKKSLEDVAEECYKKEQEVDYLDSGIESIEHHMKNMDDRFASGIGFGREEVIPTLQSILFTLKQVVKKINDGKQ